MALATLVRHNIRFLNRVDLWTRYLAISMEKTPGIHKISSETDPIETVIQVQVVISLTSTIA